MRVRIATALTVIAALASIAASDPGQPCTGTGVAADPLIGCDSVEFASDGPGVFHARFDHEFTLDFTATADGLGFQHLDLESPGRLRGVLIEGDGALSRHHYAAGFVTVNGLDGMWRSPGGDTTQDCDAGRVVCPMPAGSYTIYVLTDGAEVSGRIELGGSGSAAVSLVPTTSRFTELELTPTTGIDTPATQAVMTDGFELDMAPGDGAVFSWGPWLHYDAGTVLVDQGVCYYPSPRDERPIGEPYLPRCPFIGANTTLIGTPVAVSEGIAPFTFRWQSPSQAFGVSMHTTTVGRPVAAGGYVLELPYVD
jgi:hypothetical protein